MFIKAGSLVACTSEDWEVQVHAGGISSTYHESLSNGISHNREHIMQACQRDLTFITSMRVLIDS